MFSHFHTVLQSFPLLKRCPVPSSYPPTVFVWGSLFPCWARMQWCQPQRPQGRTLFEPLLSSWFDAVHLSVVGVFVKHPRRSIISDPSNDNVWASRLKIPSSSACYYPVLSMGWGRGELGVPFCLRLKTIGMHICIWAITHMTTSGDQVIHTFSASNQVTWCVIHLWTFFLNWWLNWCKNKSQISSLLLWVSLKGDQV